MNVFSFRFRRTRPEAARTALLAGPFLVLMLTFAPATALASAFPTDPATAFKSRVVLVAGAEAEKRDRAAEHAEMRRREEKLDRMEESHNEWRRRLEILRQERRHQPTDLDVPVYTPRGPDTRR